MTKSVANLLYSKSTTHAYNSPVIWPFVSRGGCQLRVTTLGLRSTTAGVKSLGAVEGAKTTHRQHRTHQTHGKYFDLFI
jgi:hypothetical protein